MKQMNNELLKLKFRGERDRLDGQYLIKLGDVEMFAIVSDGRPFGGLAATGWEHVSVSIKGDDRLPTWAEMCHVKSLFWEPDEVVIQYHPREADYVNFHEAVLHMWRPFSRKLPTPPTWTIGPKDGQSLLDLEREILESEEVREERKKDRRRRKSIKRRGKK